MRKSITVVLLALSISCVSTSVIGQELKPYIRLGIGTSCSDFFEGISGDIEGGIHYKGLQAGVSLALYSDRPFENMNRSLMVQTDGQSEVTFIENNQAISSKRNTSVMLQVGYDLLSLIPGNAKHHLIPFVGIGWSNLHLLKSYSHSPVGWDPDGSVSTWASSVSFETTSAFDFSVGGRYEYSITDGWRLGLSYKYLDLLERDLLSVHVSHYF